jgi:hypothetical protein
MTNTIIASFIALAVFGAASCASRPRGAHPPNPMDGVTETLNSFHVAASRADYEAYFTNWSNESVFLGTDATERWQGQQFKDFAKPYFEKGQGWTYLPRDRRVIFHANEQVATFDELLDNEKYGECRGSGVLVRSSVAQTGWTIAQYNLSFPVPNDLAAELTGKIKESKSKGAR